MKEFRDRVAVVTGAASGIGRALAGLTSGPFNAPYGVSKHGVVTLSESLSHELAIAGGRIKVSVLCPGWVNTRIIDASRNRPPGLPAVEIPADDPGALWIRKMIDEGLPPSDVANQVFEAIQEERFCILTHPEFSPA